VCVLLLLLCVFCSQVEHVEETHPPTRENLIKLLAAVDKRDKYRFFVKPVTADQVRLSYACRPPAVEGLLRSLLSPGATACLPARTEFVGGRPTPPGVRKTCVACCQRAAPTDDEPACLSLSVSVLCRNINMSSHAPNQPPNHPSGPWLL
jgi:hypothetical protein